jgi:signal transduction histidine kinase
LLNTAALALLWFRRRSVLDVWLMVMCCTGLLEDTIAATLIHTRFSLGWYAGLSYGLVTTFVVLLALLSEMTTLYANLARTVMRQRSDREAQQIAMDGMAASIAHEVNQPLGAISLNSQAALAFLAKTPPNIDELREAIEAIASDSVRGSQVVASLRTMFKRGNHGRVSLNVNDVVRDVLSLVDIDLRSQVVSVSTELHPEVPQLLADRGQLQQVLLNLIMNAIEAMRSISDRPRHLKIRSEIIQGSSGVLIAVEDTGIGINKRDNDRIFDPFFTTSITVAFSEGF